MIETGLEIIKTVLGDGVSSLEKLRGMRKDSKSLLGRDLVTLYDALNDLHAENTEILDYIDSFIEWVQTGAQHTLSSYTASVRNHLFECYRIMLRILESWDNHKRPILLYVELRDPALRRKFADMLSFKGRFVYMLESTSHQYSKHGIEFSDSEAAFRKADELLRKKNVKAFPYVENVELSFEPMDNGDLKKRDSFKIAFCNVDDLGSLQTYRQHLVAHMDRVRGIQDQLRNILVTHFMIEELF
jgi:hypothetical protein